MGIVMDNGDLKELRDKMEEKRGKTERKMGLFFWYKERKSEILWSKRWLRNYAERNDRQFSRYREISGVGWRGILMVPYLVCLFSFARVIFAHALHILELLVCLFFFMLSNFPPSIRWSRTYQWEKESKETWQCESESGNLKFKQVKQGAVLKTRQPSLWFNYIWPVENGKNGNMFTIVSQTFCLYICEGQFADIQK